MHKIRTAFLLLLISSASHGQELLARVNVITTRVSNNVNKNAFQTLQTSLANFLNNRKWTSSTFAAGEKIECNFLLSLESTDELNVYSASLTIQAARPVYSTSYLSPLVNFKDDNFTFKYQEFQQLEFNENRVTGSDPLASNLTAVFAYYAYMIIGLDGDSFAPGGGDAYFQKAQNIVNNAPDGRSVSGWKAFDGIRNRYWLAENLISSRYKDIHDVYYRYYRLGMDKLYEDEKGARNAIMDVLLKLEEFNKSNPNTMINQFFFQGKSTELIQIFSKAPTQDKAKARDILSRLDITNAGKYNEQLK